MLWAARRYGCGEPGARCEQKRVHGAGALLGCLPPAPILTIVASLQKKCYISIK